MFKRGFNAMNEEEERRKKAAEAKRGKLWRYFLKEGDEDVPVLFLTSDPICFWEHTVQEGGRYNNVPCIGEGCPHCATKKPSYVGAWLVVDRREYTYKDQNQKEQTGKDRIKLLVRGTTTGAQLQRLDKKYGLLDYEWFVTRTGTGTNTVWNFDRGDNLELTDKQIQQLRAQLPEKYRDMDFYDIILAQIESDNDEVSTPEPEVKQEEVDAVKSNIQQLDDGEEEAPKEVKRVAPRKLGKKS